MKALSRLVNNLWPIFLALVIAHTVVAFALSLDKLFVTGLIYGMTGMTTYIVSRSCHVATGVVLFLLFLTALLKAVSLLDIVYIFTFSLSLYFTLKKLIDVTT